MTTVAQFEIEFTRILDETGKLVGTPPDSLSSPDSLIPLYRLMVLTRAFDTKAIALQRTGQLGTYASSLGQEAIGAGVGTAMRSEDVLAPTYREQAAQFARGVTMTDLLVYWGGDERGSDFQGPREDFPICVPIGTQCCHAVGAAFAFKYRKQPRVCVGMLGDGATSPGRLLRIHEHCGRLESAGGLRHQQQPVGHLHAACRPERRRNPRSKIYRRRIRGSSGGRQRRARGSRGDGSRARQGAHGRRTDAHRSHHLSFARSHHRRQRRPLSQRGRSRGHAQTRSADANSHISRVEQRMVEWTTRTAWKKNARSRWRRQWPPIRPWKSRDPRRCSTPCIRFFLRSSPAQREAAIAEERDNG